MWIVFLIFEVICLAPAIVALSLHGEEVYGNTPFILKAPYKYICAAGVFIGMAVFMIICMDKQFDNEPKPKYQMIEQGVYYKRVLTK